MTQLSGFVDRLESHYGRQAQPHTTPFEIVMWENAGYLVDDARRQTIFDAFRQRIGLTPQAILDASERDLLELAWLGGMRPQQRVEKWRQTAVLALEPLPEDLKAARKALKGYPGIGDPGADKILLFMGRQPVLALESNGLRVLLRLGYGSEEKDYAATYRNVQHKAQPELPATCPALIRAHLLLRHHGQHLCRRTRPNCGDCPLAVDCPYPLT